MHTDFLLIGQGLCGTFLSWELQKEGYSCIVIDDPKPNTSSKTAAGVINPVTGRRIVKTWMIDDIMPFAWQAYTEIGNDLGITGIEQKDIVDFFPTPQMKLAFEKRYEEDTTYLAKPANENDLQPFFSYDFGYGFISPCYLVNVHDLLPAWRKVLVARNSLLEEKFDRSQLQIHPDKIQYKDITATAVIYCDGLGSNSDPLFAPMPFAPNKGEMLLIEAKDMPHEHVFKKTMAWVPWDKDIFWAGSVYEWDFTHDQPTEAFREKTMATLKQWIKVPLKIIDHQAAVRPATLERRPFVGFHPLHPSVGILNGMGTKGCSLTPWFAHQLAQHIKYKTPIQPDADIKRFERMLSRVQ